MIFEDIFNFIVILFKMHENKFRESNQIAQWIDKTNYLF